MLQPMRMGIRGYRIEDISVYIFVQTHIQRKDLPSIEYVNAEERAEAAVKLFRDLLKIDARRILVLKNFSKC